MENDLSSAGEHCKLFHIKYGECVVVNNYGGSTGLMRMLLKFDSHNASVDKNLWIYSNGKENLSDYYPSVFWSDPGIACPPKPKRKVEKAIEGWINIYPNNSGYEEISARPSDLYKSSEIADKNANKEKRMGEACYVIHKYTIEE